ncbi:aldehyde dehydrogenase family protein [Yoonia sediminilitoris]|uniref:Aldehyde dehydrogenase (NAD(P)+) n=1 Tax=Yoonia sediminilitoris TaxID=1286148 RepID=A0A2T6K6K7_9RHOB|nr:aldehyde dehydrogenase family protein [Yoonia sediminilitoris]PUB10273.1 aldehyde dehydrogenase (NAD(P)+) [Yoonia sediminilitoris]RCW89781.1 aldehyde dehydrogenase (NAD(P)+) [Yoonia sediminilitoris]
MNMANNNKAFEAEAYEADLIALEAAKDKWAQSSVETRIEILSLIKDGLMEVAEDWVTAAAKAKQIPDGSALKGEEWISGPFPVMAACNGLMTTLSHMKDKSFAKHLPTRQLPNGNTAVKVTPHSIWDHLLISGVKCEVWLQSGVNKGNLDRHVASAYDQPEAQRKGKVALILGAGNIAAITPLDAFQKLFLENQVCVIKMNPVNDYLTPFLKQALKPLIEVDALRIVNGGGPAGAYLCDHALVEEIHITGAGATHDAIVWGSGKEGEKNKKAGKPKNPRKITSELGAVCPTIVVPGFWSKADLRFQAENIATQKMHNHGYNCVACQALILPEGWKHTDALMKGLSDVMAKCARGPYYPGAQGRMDRFAESAGKTRKVQRKNGPAVEIAEIMNGDADWFTQTEVFGPAMATKTLPASDAESYLRAAIAYANDELYGTLGANIVIHPRTIKEIGKARFEEILSDLKYGTIAINGWTGIGFLITACPWGGFPNATLENVGSGIGTVHNTFMLEKVERTVVKAPWRPFPRGVLSGQLTLLPRPPWFISNKQQHHVGKLLTQFQYKPSVLKLPRIFAHALLG